MLPWSITIFRAKYPPNRHDTCGYTAACLLLFYYHRTQGALVGEEYLDEKGRLLTEGRTLQDVLLQYGTKNLTWGGSIAGVLNRYFADHALPWRAHYRILGFGARRHLEKGQEPVILFGNMPGKGDGRLNHAVLAYGLDLTKQPPRFVVHYGWRGWEQRILREAVIGSYVYLSRR